MEVRRELLNNNCPEMPGMSFRQCIFNRHFERFTRMMKQQQDTSASGSQKKSPEKKIDSIDDKTIGKTGTICTANCSYNVIRKIANMFNMKEVEEHEDWNVYWTDYLITYERAKQMKSFQKVNHFPGISAICRKDLLARNLNRMVKLFPEEYNFFPKTWCLPADHSDVTNYIRDHSSVTFIIKPDKGSRGKGIFLTKRVKNLKPKEKMICQVYLSKPFLMDGLKFDFRIYVLITSCDPLRIYVYNEGLARFATSPYCEPAADNSGNIYMHLTNYSVNKDSEVFVFDNTAGHKRRISTVDAWFNYNNYNVPKIWASIDDIIVKTVISAYPTLKHTYRTCFLGHKSTYACFELLGFDVLLDYELKPHLLEVNHSPSFQMDSYLDREVKESLLKDTFRILNLSKCDKKRVKEEDKQRIRNRMMKAIHKKGSLLINESTRSPLDTHNIQMNWEENHLGNYRQVYPSTHADKYSPYFNQTQSSLLQKKVASRARAQQEELELNLRGDTARMSGLNSRLTTSKSTALQKPKLKNIFTIDSEENTIDHSLKETMMKSTFPFCLTNEARAIIPPGDLPVSTERPTTLGGKNFKSHVPHHLPNSVTVHGIERRLCSDKNASYK